MGSTSHCCCGWNGLGGSVSQAEFCETTRVCSILLFQPSAQRIVAERPRRVQEGRLLTPWQNDPGPWRFSCWSILTTRKRPRLLSKDLTPASSPLVPKLPDPSAGSVGTVRPDPLKSVHRRPRSGWAVSAGEANTHLVRIRFARPADSQPRTMRFC